MELTMSEIVAIFILVCILVCIFVLMPIVIGSYLYGMRLGVGEYAIEESNDGEFRCIHRNLSLKIKRLVWYDKSTESHYLEKDHDHISPYAYRYEATVFKNMDDAIKLVNEHKEYVKEEKRKEFLKSSKKLTGL